MSNFVDELMRTMGQPVSKEVSQRTELSDAQVQAAMKNMAPVILGGLKRKKDAMNDEEFESMVEQLGGNELAVDNVGPTVEHTMNSEGVDLSAGGVLQAHEGEQLATAMSKNLGVGTDIAKKLIPMLAPLIIGMLMKKGKADPNTKTQSGGVKSILDRDGDGHIMDDLAGMVFGGMGKQSSGGFLQRILAMIFGRK